ncbi:hypothetical protein F4678DRAFT_451606 [Xylaria arbuscula]|nr:hypothetical protein F4678DRAFT_451606 [Xylaria arbuscula]
MQFTAYISIIVAIAGVVSSAPSPAPGNGVGVIRARTPENGNTAVKRTAGRFKPVWVVGHDEDEEKGEHIGFRLFSDGEEGDGTAHTEAVNFHGEKTDTKTHAAPKDHDDHESSFWYYYYTY